MTGLMSVLLTLATIAAIAIIGSLYERPRARMIDTVAMWRLQDARRADHRDRPRRWRWVIMAIALASLFWNLMT
jgi:hypothetical protein